jgi:hypothetical protein
MPHRFACFVALLVYLLPIHVVLGQRGHIPPGLGDKLLNGSTIGLNVHYQAYTAFTPLNQNLPYKRAYPHRKASMAGVDFVMMLDRSKANHQLLLSGTLPGYLTESGALDSTLFIDRYNSYYQSFQTDYSFSKPLWATGAFQLKYGATLSALFQRMSLIYLPQDGFRKWDMNMGAGPALFSVMKLSGGISLHGHGQCLLYTPFSSMGYLNPDPSRILANNQRYFPLTFALRGGMSIRYEHDESWQLVLGYRYTNKQGFGNEKAAFSPDKPLTNTFDSAHLVFLGFHYIIPPRWTLRKPEFPCPNSL